MRIAAGDAKYGYQDRESRRQPLAKMNGYLRMNPCPLVRGISALNNLHQGRYRNSDIARQFGQKRLRRC